LDLQDERISRIRVVVVARNPLPLSEAGFAELKN
jgi:hypothetical protein